MQLCRRKYLLFQALCAPISSIFRDVDFAEAIVICFTCINIHNNEYYVYHAVDKHEETPTLTGSGFRKLHAVRQVH